MRGRDAPRWELAGGRQGHPWHDGRGALPSTTPLGRVRRSQARADEESPQELRGAPLRSVTLEERRGKKEPKNKKSKETIDSAVSQINNPIERVWAAIYGIPLRSSRLTPC